MKRRNGVALIALFTSAATASSSESVEQVWRQWQSAAAGGDESVLENVLAPDYVGVSWREQVEDRAAAIARVREQPGKAGAAVQSKDQIVQVFGKFASVHAVLTDSSGDRPRRFVSTADFVDRDGHWVAFYSQQTLIADGVADSAVLSKAGTPSSASQAACTASEPSGDTGTYLIDIRHQWLAAELHGDTKFLDCLLAPDYRDVNYRGSSRDRTALIESAKKRADPLKPIPAVVPNQIVLREGDSAVVRNLWSGPLSGKDVKIWLADTFVRENGRWRAVFSQQTLVEE